MLEFYHVFFVLVFFFLSKKFNHITKDASILHLKSGGNNRPNYFLTSTPSGHTPITNLLQEVDGRHGRHSVNSPFSYFLFLCTFFESMVYL
jgi:hypothetical protein